MSGVVRAAWRLGVAAARGRAGRPLSQAPAGGAEGGGTEGSGGSGSREAVERLVRAHPVVVFMKGSPAQPLCGFSNAVVQILRLHGVEDYRAHDVLQDPDLRQALALVQLHGEPTRFINWITGRASCTSLLYCE
ncbi:glutaredoxin-related protein 5, mitochondrial isoform X3 [Calonectris borealis]